MLDIKYIREHQDAVRRGAEVKRIKFDLDRLLALDTELRPLQSEWEGLQAERNTLSKTIGKSPPDQREELKQQVGKIKVRMDVLTEELRVKRAAFDELMLLVPQPPRADVPVGKDD